MDNSFGQPPAENVITKDEKTLALFSHLSLFLGGIILPIIFWATNKDKSKFVTFHALQSIWFHVGYIFALVIVIMFTAMAGFGIAGLLGGFDKSHKSSGSPVIAIFVVALYGFIFLIIAGAIIYSIYMGIKAYHGELKKYPIVGNIMYKKVYGDK